MLVVTMAALAQSRAVFWAAGMGVGLCIGSTQSASRALVGLFSPPERAGEFLGFWGSFGKLSAVVGPLAFGLFSDGMSARTAVGATAGWFVLGFLGMFLVDEREGIAAAHGGE
jgi:UMF1 family MFS transporter